MSPFSIVIRQLRVDRKIQQKHAAELMGYEQSYLSALESGKKGPPKIDFLEKMALKYKLDEGEKLFLFESWKRSKRNFLLPRNASSSEYEIWYALEEQTGRLHPIQIEMIRNVLTLNSHLSDHL